MRISDWSSDVCSSDLLCGLAPVFSSFRSSSSTAERIRIHGFLTSKAPPKTGAPATHRGRLREGAESYAKLAQIAGARSYLLLPSTVAPERRRLSSIRRWLRILKVSGPRRRHPMKPRERQNRSAARSEEHTSELQSLIRTSYAVFCLKKKKKKAIAEKNVQADTIH